MGSRSGSRSRKNDAGGTKLPGSRAEGTAVAEAIFWGAIVMLLVWGIVIVFFTVVMMAQDFWNHWRNR